MNQTASWILHGRIESQRVMIQTLHHYPHSLMRSKKIAFWTNVSICLGPILLGLYWLYFIVSADERLLVKTRVQSTMPVHQAVMQYVSAFLCSHQVPQCECRDVHINCTNKQLMSLPSEVEPQITWLLVFTLFTHSSKTNWTENN